MSSSIYLLADDDRDDREMFCEALGMIDTRISCECVENGHDVLRRLSELAYEPQLIFLDVNMPVMNGWQCLKLLKKDARYSQIPVIMISTSSHQREIKMATELGALCYFTKPNEFSDLTQVLQVIAANPGAALPGAIQHLQADGSPFIYAARE